MALQGTGVRELSLTIAGTGRPVMPVVQGDNPAPPSPAAYGNPCTCGPTALDHAFPAAASQFVDQVIAPRRSG